MDEQTLNDLLECSVCLERLDTSSKVLPCQHTFCRKCLEVIVSNRQELRCPECRVLVEIKIDDLPPNVLLMRILEGMKNAASADIEKDNNSQQQQQALSPQQQHTQQRKQQHQSCLQQLHQEQQQQKLHLQFNLHGLDPNSLDHQQLHLQKQRCLLPYAYALYDFESSEPTDLKFKKGDLVLLKRKVDTNWYVGQLSNGNGIVSEGTFPINHVQVIVPLPAPQCIALYDFKMPPNEQQGCLTFKKGTIINVLRRVDQNWAEGCINTAIGIFPIAFVEMNELAKNVLETANIAQVASPSLPPIADAGRLNGSNSASAGMGCVQQISLSQLCNSPPIAQNVLIHSESVTSSSSQSNSSSNATSPSSICPIATTIATTSDAIIDGSGISSTSMPSSPNQSFTASPHHGIPIADIGSDSNSIRFRDKQEKRHSLSALLSSGLQSTGTTFSILQHNRHSAEILSKPNETPTFSHVSQSSGDSSSPSQQNIQATNVVEPQSTATREQQEPNHQQLHQMQQRVNVLKTSVVQQHNPPTLPWGYLALYPYKPRKIDELELKKGYIYIVTEHCLDGWFKGKNCQDITGVFPGNYVTPLRSRDQQQLMHQWKYVQSSSPSNYQANATATINKCINILSPPDFASTSQSIQNLYKPPDLPPRQTISALPISSVWTKPLGHVIESFFNKQSKSHYIPKDQTNSKQKDIDEQKENAINTCSNTDVASTSTTSSTCSAVQLMKRLGHIKSRSKSPSNTMARQQLKIPPSQTESDKKILDNTHNSCKKSSGGHAIRNNNTHFNSTATHGHMHPVHVRSGSCPSQLLESVLHDKATTISHLGGSTTMSQIQKNALKTSLYSPHHKHQQHNRQPTSHVIGYGSQQLRGPKERKNLQSIHSMDVAALRGIYNSSVAQHQQQHKENFENNFAEQQNSATTQNSNHRKSHSFDEMSVLSSTNISDSAIYVTGSNNGVAELISPCNITLADVAASATTKSTQNSGESRVRCVVPYPPNSEIELELQVGDIIYVQRRQKNGWYKGTHSHTNKTGLFPASFVEPDI